MNSDARPTVLLSLLASLAFPLHAAEHQDHAATRADRDPKPYPLGTCVVSGEKLAGNMGDPVVLVHQGGEVKLCCKSCEEDFDKDIKRFMSKLKEASAKAKSDQHKQHQH